MTDARVVVVTGAASGIGHATAVMFRELGDVVVGLDLGDTVPDGVAFRRCDVSSRTDVEATITAVVAEHSRLDVLANVAGIVQFGRIETITDEEWARVMAVDLTGPFLTTQAALPHLRATRGSVVNVSSVSGRTPQPYAAAYAAAKGGLNAMTRAMALELAPDGVRLNVVCPGATDTPILGQVAARFPDDLDARVADRLMPMIPGPTTTAAEVAAAIVYLASPAARMVSGAVLAIDGGMS